MYCTIDVSVELQFQFHTLFKENADVLAYLSCVVGHHFVEAASAAASVSPLLFWF
jgi:hypothetical protein